MKFLSYFVLISVVLLNSFFAAPTSAASGESIHLSVKEETATSLSLILQSNTINKPLIGISTLLHLPEGISYQSYDPGQFFEQANNQVTYLIAPKKNDPQTLVIGIASLGKAVPNSQGTIVTLHFQKQTSFSSIKTLALADSIASGTNNQKRVDYKDIVWTTDISLASTGSKLLLVVLISFFISLSVIVAKKLFQERINLLLANEVRSKREE